MNGDLMLELRKAASSTFEQVGFLFPEEEVTEEQAAAEVVGSCRVRFRGPLSGVLEMEAAGGFLGEMTGNMLGTEEEPSAEVVLDALGEVTNVICGNVLPALGGANAVFDLSAPEVSLHPLRPSAAREGQVAKVSLGVEEGRVEITLRLYG
jgi:CheY-specific phosphatase CheX